ncbi:unnamed protein product [Alternaria alternata]
MASPTSTPRQHLWGNGVQGARAMLQVADRIRNGITSITTLISALQFEIEELEAFQDDRAAEIKARESTLYNEKIRIKKLEQDINADKARYSANPDAKQELEELKQRLSEMGAIAKVKNSQIVTVE